MVAGLYASLGAASAFWFRLPGTIGVTGPLFWSEQTGHRQLPAFLLLGIDVVAELDKIRMTELFFS